MSDIFLSYAREDHSRAEALARALEGCGWSVFWDHSIPAGLDWDTYIEGKLKESRCVVVAWSRDSVGSRYVREEAQMGLDRQILIPVRLERISPPFGFGRIQAIDLVGWRGQPDATLGRLVKGIERVLGPAPQGHAGPAAPPAKKKARRKTTSTKEQTRSRIVGLIADHLSVDPSRVQPNATLKGDLGFDELDMLELVMAIEEEFGLEIPDGEAGRFGTVGDIGRYLGKRLS